MFYVEQVAEYWYDSSPARVLPGKGYESEACSTWNTLLFCCDEQERFGI